MTSVTRDAKALGTDAWLVAHSSGGLVVPGVVANLGHLVRHIVLNAASAPARRWPRPRLHAPSPPGADGGSARPRDEGRARTTPPGAACGAGEQLRHAYASSAP